MTTQIRRVVTAQVGGKGVITSDGSAPAVVTLETGMVLVDVWKVHETPCDLARRDDAPEAGPLSLLPPRRGNVLRITDFPPEPEQGTGADTATRMFAQLGAGQTLNSDERSTLMHRTDTLDYGIVLDGEITMLVDDGEVLLRTGDVVVQRGANHGWINRSGRVCRMAFILVDAGVAR